MRSTLVTFSVLAPLLLGAAGLAHACGQGAEPPCPCTLLPIGVTPSPGPEFVAGCTEYVLLPGHRQGDPDVGFVLDLPECPLAPCATENAARRIRCLALNDYPCCLDSGTSVPILPGNRMNEILDGLHARWALDMDQRSGICYQEYRGDGPRVVRVFVVQPGREDRRTVRVVRVARFFLGRLPARPGDDLTGQFLGHEP